MTKSVWTPWLKNPGTDECPVPEWAENFVTRKRDGNISVDPLWWSNTELPQDITYYSYAIPADLAWLAENVSEWNESSSRILFRDENGHPVFCYEHKDLIIPSYTKAQWLRARQDLGYESGEKVGVKDDNPPIPSKYHRHRLRPSSRMG